MELVISDGHQGLKNAIATVFAGAGWQRCRTHFMTNLLTRVPERSQPGVATMVRTIYRQPSPGEVHAQAERGWQHDSGSTSPRPPRCGQTLYMCAWAVIRHDARCAGFMTEYVSEGSRATCRWWR